MSKRNKPARVSGRFVIDALKQHYLNGGNFADCWAVLTFVRGLGGKFRKTSVGQATDWERQARYEGWDDLLAVSIPIPNNGGLRDPKADWTEHLRGQLHLTKHKVTRTRSLYRHAKAAAAQPDATPAMHERVGRLEVELAIAERELVWIKAKLTEMTAPVLASANLS